MTDLERTAATLRLLPEIMAVGTGETFGRAGDALFIVASEPAPFERIAALTEGLEQVEVVEALDISPCPHDVALRFRSEPGMTMFVHDRFGRPMIDNDAEDFADHLGITVPPLNAVMDGRLGLLFRSIGDAIRYDAVRAAAIDGEPVPDRPVRLA